jgi:hypothetical protein
LGNFTDENDDLTGGDGLELPSDVFVDFPRAQHQMTQLFGPKHIISLELQLEYVMTSRVGLDPTVMEVLYLVEKVSTRSILIHTFFSSNETLTLLNNS